MIQKINVKGLASFVCIFGPLRSISCVSSSSLMITTFITPQWFMCRQSQVCPIISRLFSPMGCYYLLRRIVRGGNLSAIFSRVVVGFLHPASQKQSPYKYMIQEPIYQFYFIDFLSHLSHETFFPLTLMFQSTFWDSIIIKIAPLTTSS